MGKWRLYECSLRNSEHNLQLMQTSCTNEQQRKRQREIRGDTTQLRQMSEPNVNMVNDRNAQERYLQFLSRTNNQNSDYTDQSNKIEQDNSCSSEWEEWMKNQPISVLRLDRTERLVLKIGEL
ncbi:unnamed protein product [Onchocerca flexuosa]|uniref:Uncharacterized protein n=1 Tax=Onchocerca flexuosa TaxID=387005 RepID=A0A183H3S1_9BILA|nr:unnamed protein product [Onchocerca flexuosa]